MKNLTKSGKSFMLKMQTDPGATEKIEIYHSLDAKIWKKVSGVKYDDNDIASFDAHEGKNCDLFLKF